MDAGIFARQLTEALDNLAAGISTDPAATIEVIARAATRALTG